jgi:hypothetical protein
MWGLGEGGVKGMGGGRGRGPATELPLDGEDKCFGYQRNILSGYLIGEALISKDMYRITGMDI